MSITRVTQAVYRAIDEVNPQLPLENRLMKSSDSVLFDTAGNLDSLGLVKLIIAAEKQIKEEFGKAVSIVNNISVSEIKNPFKTVQTLSEYILSLLNEGS